ncbi:MAG: imidazole glycerol phosphate synthase subunit HisH [Deltaproteobacteria bacterium]|nr:imidazole glycerol phosphate synthase subunit HisH [Deltaproteobacteria bacterium]
MGNVRSVVRAIERSVGARATVTVTRERADVARADVLVVPGQGAFGSFARAVEASGVGDAIREHLQSGRPYFGICLGMQVLFESSDEAPSARGLGVFAGHVARLTPGEDPETRAPFALPHIGWNAVETSGSPSRYFYFAHSYAVSPSDPAIVTGTTQYGAARFVSSIAKGSIVGVQFHPEKSQREGLALLGAVLR